MAWLLDTNLWIFHLKNPAGPVEARLNLLRPSDIRLCSIVKAELWHGAEKYGNRERRLAALDLLFRPFESLPFDDVAARHYATIRHNLETQSSVIGPNDLKIAAICLAHKLTLATSNTAEFSRVSGLRIENWLAPSDSA
jgi:tRNA(fMet)-specific endonuclease VapC